MSDRRDRSLAAGDDIPELLTVDSFLASDLARALIGRRSAGYLRKFQRLRDKGARSPARIARGSGWNWAALLLPLPWALYRRLYGLAGVLLVLHLAMALLCLPGAATDASRAAAAALLLGTALVTARRADGLYFRTVYRRWGALRDAGWDAQQHFARRLGGTAPLLAGAGALCLGALGGLLAVA